MGDSVSARIWHIAFFMRDLSGGGVERMRLRLAGALTARGHRVTLVVQSKDGPLERLLPNGVELVCLGTRRTSSSLFALVRYLAMDAPDFLVSSLVHNNLAALAASALAGGHTRVIACQHNTLSAEAALGWKYRIAPSLYRLLASRAASFLAVSRGVADDMARMCGIRRDRIAVIYNPVVDDAPSEVPPAPASYRYIVFAGRLVPQKNPELLLLAFAQSAARADRQLVILGDGPLRTSLELLAQELGIADRVVFAGFVANVRDWIAHAEVLVLPSRYEGLGNVLIEALSCGTPVIATDCPHGPAEILEGGRFGRLVGVGDARALAACLDEDLRAAFPADLLRGRASDFSLNAAAAAHEALFARTAPVSHPFALEVTGLSAREIARRLADERADSCQLVVTPNLDHLRLLDDEEFASAYRSAALVCPDGFPVAFHAWFSRAARLRRVTGCDIYRALVADPVARTRRFSIIVESEGTVRALRVWLKSAAWPEWQIFLAPPRLRDDDAGANRLARDIAAYRPDILLMTLGAPVSEVFVHEHRHILPPCWALCVGQAVRVELGLVQRPPPSWRHLGLEWAWRLRAEPRRLAGRYGTAALHFPRVLLQDLWRQAKV